MKNLTKQQKFILYKFLHRKIWNMNMKELEELQTLLGEDNKFGDLVNELLKPLNN